MGKDLQLSENLCTMKVFPLEYFAVYSSMERTCMGSYWFVSIKATALLTKWIAKSLWQL